ncbi:hypothetical protein PILCRDRAFT_822651 [Piloderma croceum F 1598]|uniref:F-box domain-containing protein n=1 Tax=Piloderma croceum (strain F 1598) TaxID=765440 RepID=A0A0C3BS61_PILCF|nr:hypothetical protein PILCRDRAFT_822651 [Piloderma croceum F 1598]
MDYDTSSFSLQCSPLLVSRVCRGWRQVALSTQKLWSFITPTYYRPSSAQAKLWISRASSAPLTIDLNSVNIKNADIEKFEAVIAVLVQHCDRWRHLDLRIHRTMMPCLGPIKHRLPWLESLRIQWPTQFHSRNIFEVAPRLRNLFLGPNILHTMLQVPWHQVKDLHAHVMTVTECLEMLQLVPNLVKCTIQASSMLKAPIFLDNIPILTFPHLRFFHILQLHPDEIFNYIKLPIIHTLHVSYYDKWPGRNGKWFSRQPFMSLLSCSSHTLRKLVVDHLDESEDSARISHCLRATPSLEELCLRGPGAWVTADFLSLLIRQASIKVLVPGLEVLEISSRSIPCYHSASMIESRWRVGEDDDGTGARLKRLLFEMPCAMAYEWLVDTEILNRLRKCRQEGMVISIIEDPGRYQRDLLDIPHSSPVT